MEQCLATIQARGVLRTGCSEQFWPVTDAQMQSGHNLSWGEWESHEISFGVPSTRLPAFEVLVTPIYTLESSAALMKVGLWRWESSVTER